MESKLHMERLKEPGTFSFQKRRLRVRSMLAVSKYFKGSHKEDKRKTVLPCHQGQDTRQRV